MSDVDGLIEVLREVTDNVLADGETAAMLESLDIDTYALLPAFARELLAHPWGQEQSRLVSENAALRERVEALDTELRGARLWFQRAEALTQERDRLREALEASAGAFAAIIHIAVTEDGRRKWAQTGFDEARAALAAHEPQEPS